MSRRAVFFDRDGTLCREVGYINHPERLELIDGAVEAIEAVRERDWAAVVATNQAGVARGYFPVHVLDETMERLHALLAAGGTRLDRAYVCAHHPDLGGPGFRRRCGCRKPAPGMLEQAARDLHLDLSRSFIVGDTFKDVGAGRAAGLAGVVMLRTGYGRGELMWNSARTDHWPDFIADDLASALEWIIRREEDGP
ncbi:MAG: HAD-IIIA family hydrolase [Acidobacteriota bacterium]|nr:MAG: HAD-IIIA family hydrolase [Acidobacteriota bacterium]